MASSFGAEIRVGGSPARLVDGVMVVEKPAPRGGYFAECSNPNPGESPIRIWSDHEDDPRAKVLGIVDMAAALGYPLDQMRRLSAEEFDRETTLSGQSVRDLLDKNRARIAAAGRRR